ncbi:Tumor necrosis factor receptor superfamily member 14 [Microtus ochrogaster]|uniref:Tumor necrosis factor receptor superfamily member 14 n=1 Tax=Microtus ochrogaster TaxID=79684 RepID=A0A8J6GS56_MICOH|nr:Tumor necrosis factor receptor superfamily member 14 [Microtus ochrogaster]
MAKQLLNSEPKPHLHCSAVLEQPRAAAVLRSVWKFPFRVAKGLCVFLLNFLSCVAVEPLCKEEEYSVGDHCCPMCNPDMGLVTWRECSSREDTVCRCIPGYFCETQEGDHCSTCSPHTNCSLGQRVLERGPAAREVEHLQRQEKDNTVKLPVLEVGSAEEETAFNHGLCVFLLNFLSCVAVEPLCKEEEYSVGDHCCPMCNPDMGLVTWRECSSREDTVCRCIPGYFCETQEGDHCSTCSPHTNCSLGQRVLERGNYFQDTVCADCPTGTFSPGGAQEECLPWTK